MNDHISTHISGILSTLPKTPGVYQMKNRDGGIIYVGKAKNLKSRVSSYFLRTSELTPAKQNMVKQIYSIDITLTNTEVEALILETNLIKHLHPKYNILMKDDKNLTYIKITGSVVPEIIKTRRRIVDGGKYFGPYIVGVEHTIRYLRKLFRIRNCRVQFEKRKDGIIITDRAGKTLPCMDYYIGLCPAPCTLDPIKIHEHHANIQSAREFLQGKHTQILSGVEEDMINCAQKLDFEGAQEKKELLSGLKNLFEFQTVRDKIQGNHDIVVLYDRSDRYYVGLTQVRDSRVIGNLRYEVETKLGEKKAEILSEFLANHYMGEHPESIGFPDTIVLEGDFSEEAILDFFSARRISVDTPKSGPRHDLITFTRNQLREYAYKSELANLEQKTLTRTHMENILLRLGYHVPKSGPIRFECYDISHTHGYFTVASRIVIENGKTLNQLYKKYNIKTLENGQIDDFSSHKEVMKRRTIEGLELANFPHLIIIDGGKGQLSSALAGIDLGVSSWTAQKSELGYVEGMSKEEIHARIPPLCSLAKREEELFLPSQSNSIHFEKGSPELMVLQKARDESHRFSITANRGARTKAMKKNILEELSGFGPITRKKLMKVAGSLDGIGALSTDILLKICTQKQIETLRDHGIVR